MNTDNLSNKEVASLIQAVGGPIGARKLIAGTLQITESFPLFGKLVVGGSPYSPKGKMVDLLKKKKYLKDELTEKVLRSPKHTISRTKQELELVLVLAAKLSPRGGGFLSDLVAVAKSRGLELCPQDTAARLVLQMTEWWIPPGGNVIIVTKPIWYYKQEYLLKISEHRLSLVTAFGGNYIEADQSLLFCRQ